MAASALARTMHRMHRAVGGALSLLLLAWFVSGGVMAFSGYPRFTETERLASAAPLPPTATIEVPAALSRFLVARAAKDGSRARLSMQEGAPTWSFDDPEAGRVALRAAPPHAVTPLDAVRARAEAERRLQQGVADVTLLTESDQWTVAIARPGTFPVYRVRFAGPEGREAYLTARTGEVVQDSLREERTLAWVGAIPHWIYPTLLRRERDLWRTSVLALSALGLVATLSGMLVGLHVWRATRKRRISLRDPYLRWHQALGLTFGTFASLWLFSGALSLSPFQWSGGSLVSAGEQVALYQGVLLPKVLPVQAALRRCQGALTVRELELAVLGDGVYAVCSDAARETRVVDLNDPELSPRPTLGSARLQTLARGLAGAAPHDLTLARTFDDYHYPTHDAPEAALPYARIAVEDPDRSTYYVDPARAKLIRRHTDRTRLERWLYHGLHSIDLPSLYRHPGWWRALIVAAMTIGAALSGLGLVMQLRRWRRSSLRRRRA